MMICFEKIAPPRAPPGSGEPVQLPVPVKLEIGWLAAQFNRLQLWHAFRLIKRLSRQPQ
jgi:hypothetical protein